MTLRVGLEPQPQLDAVLGLLATAGLPVAALRGLQHQPGVLEADGVTWVRAAGADLLSCCERGGLDLAVVGKELLLEHEPDVYELLDLRVAPARLVFAVSGGPHGPREGRLRVATRFPRVTARYFAAGGLQVQPVRLTSSATLAVSLGLADGVVELDTVVGAAAIPGLERRETVARCGARLVAGRAARSLRGAEVAALLGRLRELLEDR
jgi:ATP phosphoribosyltransferase